MQDLAELKDWLGAGAINLFGLPMSGKDTQGERLAAALGAQLLSAGALVRQTGIGGAEAAAGKLVATDVFQEVILPNLVAGGGMAKRNLCWRGWRNLDTNLKWWCYWICQKMRCGGVGERRRSMAGS